MIHGQKNIKVYRDELMLTGPQFGYHQCAQGDSY